MRGGRPAGEAGPDVLPGQAVLGEHQEGRGGRGGGNGGGEGAHHQDYSNFLITNKNKTKLNLIIFLF